MAVALLGVRPLCVVMVFLEAYCTKPGERLAYLDSIRRLRISTVTDFRDV